MTHRILTYRSRLAQFVALCALCAAGALAALSFAPAAGAWGPSDLPPGFTLHHYYSAGWTAPSDLAGPCPAWDVIYGGGASSPDLCENSPTYQQDFDAWVNAHYTAPVTTTAAPTTTAADTTTTTTTTTTEAATTAPADTTTTAAAALPAPPTQTVTVTTPDPAVTAAIADLQAQIDALSAQVAQLVAIIEKFPNLDPAILAALMALAP